MAMADTIKNWMAASVAHVAVRGLQRRRASTSRSKSSGRPQLSISCRARSR
jgi:hypothetical protein